MTSPPAAVLRASTDADLDVLFRVAADLDTWEERRPEPPTTLTRTAFEARLQRIEAEAAPGDVRFVVEADGTAVGGVSLFGVDPLARHGEVGVALLPEARGRGIGTLAVERLVEFAFVRGNLRRLHLQAVASNAAAIRSYEMAGFRQEGRLREHAWVRGAYEDIVLMGLLRADRPRRLPGAAPVRS